MAVIQSQGLHGPTRAYTGLHGDFECNGDFSSTNVPTGGIRHVLGYDIYMKLENIGQVIAVRTLYLANDPSRKMVVRMGKPQPLPDALGDHHFCPYQISGAGTEKIFYGAGVDAFQALELGLKMIGAELAALNRRLDGELRWECDEQGSFGFPVP